MSIPLNDRHVADEWAMREQWKGRRAELDAGFEAHIRQRGPWREG